MEISKGIQIQGLALLIKPENILVIGDTHIGMEAALNEEGMLIPRFQFNEIMQETKKIIKKTKPKLIILNGDIKHNFGSISRQEWQNTKKYLELLEKNSKVIFIKGNHDTILGPIAEKQNVEIKKHYKIRDIYVCHGHEIPRDKEYEEAKRIIIGHEHPAISLREGPRTEKYKCYLKGKHESKELIVMPSMTMVNEGTDVLKEKLLSPFLKDKSIKNFEAYLLGDKVYYFGKIQGFSNIN